MRITRTTFILVAALLALASLLYADDDVAPPPEAKSVDAAPAAEDAASQPKVNSVDAAAVPPPPKVKSVDAAAAPPKVKNAAVPKVVVVPSPQAKNIGVAMTVAYPGDTVKVKNGVYRDKVFVAPGVVFVSENLFGAVIDGGGRGTVVTLSNSSEISGFEIRNGTVGVFSATAQAIIRRCRIMHNVQSGVMCVGALPKMEDNFIVFNKGSGVQGWDVRTTSGSINHNTIAFNANHGISLGGNTSITVENNIIAFNDQFGVKPAEETVRVMLINNNFYQNARISSNLPSDNISADPMFEDAKRFNFNLMKDSHSIGLGTDNQNLGSRILH